MTSEERREIRYQNRKRAREQKREKRLSQYDDFEKVISCKALVDGCKQSQKGVTWKASVQRYIMNLLRNTATLHRDLAAAAQESNFSRIKRRCSELGKSFAEFAAEHDIFSKMLNFWKVNRRLVENVRLILSEGIAIPPEWRAELLTLSGEDDLVRELHQLLGQFEQ